MTHPVNGTEERLEKLIALQERAVMLLEAMKAANEALRESLSEAKRGKVR